MVASALPAMNASDEMIGGEELSQPLGASFERWLSKMVGYVALVGACAGIVRAMI